MEIQYKQNPPSIEENQPSSNRQHRFRYLTIQRRYKHEKNVPELRLVGLWLGRCGFKIGEQVMITVSDKLLEIRLIESDESPKSLGL